MQQEKHFFLKNHTQNVVEKLVPNPFLKNQELTYLGITSMKFDKVVFIVCPGQGQSKYIEIKVKTTCFYLK